MPVHWILRRWISRAFHNVTHAFCEPNVALQHVEHVPDEPVVLRETEEGCAQLVQFFAHCATMHDWEDVLSAHHP